MDLLFKVMSGTDTWKYGGGVKHKPDTPLLPQGNAEAESFLWPIKKLLQTCQI